MQLALFLSGTGYAHLEILFMDISQLRYRF